MQGYRKFKYIVIVADLPDPEDYVVPCGACRQVLCEFNPDIPIYLVKADMMVKITDLGVLLPDSFSPLRMKFDFHKGEEIKTKIDVKENDQDAANCCLLYTSPSPRDRQKARMPSSA